MKPSEGCVFIAYDLKDADEAEQLAAALEAKGVDVWLGWRDKRTVRDASDYAEQLREAAGNCGALLLLLTGRKVDLEELGELTQRAYAADKPIYPVRTSETAEVPDFPALLRARAVVDAHGDDREAALDRLAGELGGGSGAGEAASEPEPEQPSEAAPAAPSWPSAGEAPAPPAWPTPPAPAPAPPAPAWPQQPAAPAPAAGGWPPAPAAPAAGGWPQPGAAPAAAPAAAWPAAASGPPAASGASWQPAGGPPVDGEREQRLREFVGPNSDFYLRKWGDMDRSGSNASWNFASFFLNAWWLAYRKMVLPALLVLVAILAVAGIGLALPEVGAIVSLLALGIPIFLGVMGNKLYRNQAERALADPSAAHPGALQSRGGTSIGLALGLLAAYIVLYGAMILMFMEANIGIFERSYRPTSSYGTGTTTTTPPMGNTTTGTTGTTTGTTVYSTWLTGKWGLSGTNCLSWVQFFGDGSLIDNAGTTGTWTLNNYTSTLNIATPSGNRTGTVSRRGETLIIDSSEGRREWQRCY